MCETDHLPTVSALDALWLEVTSKPLWSKPNFWRYLRLRRSMRLKLLDPSRVRVLAPTGKINDCGSCTDICCIGPSSTVLLRFRDIATLVDLGRHQLMTHHKPRFSENEQGERPALRRHVASDAWRRNLPGAAPERHGGVRCPVARWAVLPLPNWPLSCARFPYALHVDDGEAFYSPRCDSYWIRPDATPRVRAMARVAVESYNERIKDAVLLEYARPQLDGLGLTRFLTSNP